MIHLFTDETAIHLAYEFSNQIPIGGRIKMIQRFIEIGEGYSDIYELLEIAKRNQDRISHFLVLYTVKNGKEVCSFVIVLKPTEIGDFQPLYICREGIPNPQKKTNKRFELFQQAAETYGHELIELVVKPSDQFSDVELYYQHLIGILRMNRYIPSLQ
jgi:hypothetical protein